MGHVRSFFRRASLVVEIRTALIKHQQSTSTYFEHWTSKFLGLSSSVIRGSCQQKEWELEDDRVYNHFQRNERAFKGKSLA